MFSGIVQAIGRIDRSEAHAGGRRVRVTCSGLGAIAAGDSIAVNGACLTVTQSDADAFSADVSAATLDSTTLGTLEAGAAVNLETALTPDLPLGGHLVSGHVDGVGEMLARDPDGESARMRFRVPAALARYIARKGSICIDGVSLTVNAVEGSEFEVNVIPYTLYNTTLGDLAPGDAVNIEVDQIARYLERLLERDV